MEGGRHPPSGGITRTRRRPMAGWSTTTCGRSRQTSATPVTPPRVSTDLDVLVNASVVTGGVREFVVAIETAGFVLVGASPEGIAHRYRRGGVSVDVLAPEGLGLRADLTTTPPGRIVVAASVIGRPDSSR